MIEDNKKIIYSFTCDLDDYSDFRKENEVNERIKKRIIENLIRDKAIVFSWEKDLLKKEITIKATVNISK